MIDWDRVEELRAEVGALDFIEVTELFLGEVEQVLDRLFTERNEGTMASDLHFVKGSALNLGFRFLAESCHRAEKAAARGDFGSVNLDNLHTIYLASRDEFFMNDVALTSAA